MQGALFLPFASQSRHKQPRDPRAALLIFALCFAVGYQNKGFEDEMFNYTGVSFTPVSGDKTKMTLGDIKANEDCIFSAIQFWTSGGANKKVTVNEFVNVSANYTYWSDPEWSEAGVVGWYLEDDTDGKYPQNDVVIKAGSGFIFGRDGTEPSAAISLPSAL